MEEVRERIREQHNLQHRFKPYTLLLYLTIIVILQVSVSFSTTSVQEIYLGETSAIYPTVSVIFSEPVKINSISFHSSTATLPISYQGSNCAQQNSEYCTNYSFTSYLPLMKGQYTISLNVTDLYNNGLLANLHFNETNGTELSISLVSPPPVGFSSVVPFNFSVKQPLRVGNKCKYAFVYEFFEELSPPTGSETNFSDIYTLMHNFSYLEDNLIFSQNFTSCENVDQNCFDDGDYTNVIFVLCNYTFMTGHPWIWNYFSAGYDSTPPQIDAHPIPQTVLDFSNPISTIHISTNEPITCNAICISGPSCENIGIHPFTPYSSNNYSDYLLPTQYVDIDFRQAVSGQYKFNVTCVNPAQLLSIKTVNITYYPSFELRFNITKPSSLESELPITIEAKMESPEGGEVNCQYGFDDSIPDRNMETHPGQEFYLFNDSVYSLSEGTHTVTVNCTYTLAQYSTYRYKSKQFTLDITPPQVSILNVSDPTCSLNSMWFRVNSSDETSGVSHIHYEIIAPDGTVIDTGDSSIIQGVIYVDGLPLEDGKTYSIRAIAVDYAEHNSSPSEMTFDAISPGNTICDFEPPQTSYTEWQCGDAKCVNITCQDDSSGCTDRFFYSLHTNFSEECNFAYARDYDNLPISIYETSKLCWMVEDQAGNNISDIAYITVPPPQPQAHCSNGILDEDEEGIDCGGSCPPCTSTTGCESDEDCASGYQCMNGTCEEITQPTNDTDYDGIPDTWEQTYCGGDCDPYEDLDGDGISNIDEYNYGTDPTEKDTDGDGVDDGTEILQGTDPLDPESVMKGNKFNLLLIIIPILLLILIGGGTYYYLTNKKIKKEKPRILYEMKPKRTEIKINLEEIKKKNPELAKKIEKRKKLKEILMRISKQRKRKEREELLKAFEESTIAKEPTSTKIKTEQQQAKETTKKVREQYKEQKKQISKREEETKKEEKKKEEKQKTQKGKLSYVPIEKLSESQTIKKGEEDIVEKLRKLTGLEKEKVEEKINVISEKPTPKEKSDEILDIFSTSFDPKIFEALLRELLSSGRLSSREVFFTIMEMKRRGLITSQEATTLLKSLGVIESQ